MARRVPASTVCPSPSAKPDLCAVRRVCRALWARTRPTVADSQPIRRRLLPGRSPRSACRVSGSTFFPVVESLLEDFALDAGEQVTGYVGDELGAQRVVPDLPNLGVGLSEVVVLRVQFVGSTHHRSIGLPAVIHRTGRSESGPPTEFGPTPPGRRCARRPSRRRTCSRSPASAGG